MIKRSLEIVRDLRYQSLAPNVLQAGYVLSFGKEDDAFKLVDLSRGAGKLTSGSTQPWMLIGAAHVLSERGHFERLGLPVEDSEVTYAYSVTELGKLSIARGIDLSEPPEVITPAMICELQEINAAHTIADAVN